MSTNTLYRNIVLAIFSLVFYAWGEPMWIFLMLFSAFFDYFNGIFIEKFRGEWKAKFFVVVSIIGNVGLLVAYKYGGFIWDNLNALFPMPVDRPTNSLPIGISFYTFQTISYSVDVYRGDVKAQRNPLNFLMYVSLFHQLVAGPIVRYQLIAQQIEKRVVNWSMISDGVSRFCFGLFKKVVIANIAGELVDKYLESGFHDLSSIEAWFGITMFSIQLYFDFSGYSDMAIGLGRLFGFTYEENFRHPYAAISAGDFYRRWHISLGKFLRDYVYIPLGGNRSNQLRNIMIVWLLTGFWHGASWNFVLWGFYFGCIMIIEKLLDKYLKQTPRFIKHFYTLILIIFSRAIFYFIDFGRLKEFTIMLFNSPNSIGISFEADLMMHLYWFVLVIILCIPWDEIFKEENKFRIKTQSIYQYMQPAVNLGMLLISTILLVDDTYNPFLYFRF